MGWHWYRLGPFRFDGELLYRETTPVPLSQPFAQVLRALIECRGHLAKKPALRSAYGARASDHQLNKAVCELRKALGITDAGTTIAGTAMWIRTVEREGYVLEDPAREISLLYEPSIEAERACFEGRERLNLREPGAVVSAGACAQRAIKHAPGYALGYACLADAYAVLGAYWWMEPLAAADKALLAAQRALDFDRQLAEPHATVGFVRSLFQHRWSEAGQAFLTCLDHAPDYGVGHHWYALHLAATCQLTDAAHEIGLARRSDRSRSVDVHCATIQYWSRDYREAERLCRRALSEHPDFWYAHYQLGLIYEAQGRCQEALAEQRDAVCCVEGPAGLTLAALARAAALAGEREEAERLLARACSVPPPMLASFHLAAAHAALGDKTRAFGVLERACTEQDLWMSYVAVDPRMDELRGDRRFARVLEQLDLTRARLSVCPG